MAAEETPDIGEVDIEPHPPDGSRGGKPWLPDMAEHLPGEADGLLCEIYFGARSIEERASALQDREGWNVTPFEERLIKRHDADEVERIKSTFELLRKTLPFTERYDLEGFATLMISREISDRTWRTFPEYADLVPARDDNVIRLRVERGRPDAGPEAA